MSGPLDRICSNASSGPGGKGYLERYIVENFTFLRACFTQKFGTDRADDILHDLFIRISSAEKSLKISCPKSYIIRAAKNIFIDIIRRGKASASEFHDEEYYLALPIQSEASDFKKYIIDLPAGLRDVLILNHVYGYTHREIAARFGISVKAVEKRMQKAMALCAAKLKD